MFEKVNPSHPDKVADRIAGAIVDLAYKKSTNPKIAVEVLIGHGNATIIIESSELFNYDEIYPIVKRIANCEVELNLVSVHQDAHLAKNQDKIVRCGDNGIFRGCHTTEEQETLTKIASEIYQLVPYDGKYIIDSVWGDIYSLTICQSHINEKQQDELSHFISKRYRVNHATINPIGQWTGGIDVDCGATNRKLGSDMGDGITGGGLHGKDLSKADVSVNIWCYLESIRTRKKVEAVCSIGDDMVNGIPYSEIVRQAKDYIDSIGGFEKFAEWGLIRPKE